VRDVRVYYNFGQDADVEWEVDEIMAHQWDGRSLRLLVKWSLGDTTWGPESGGYAPSPTAGPGVGRAEAERYVLTSWPKLPI